MNGRKIGYIFSRNFVEPSFAALDGAFDELCAAGITELVLDLRYNGGGTVNVAQHFGALLGGAVARDQVFGQYVHNDKNGFRSRTLRFEPKPNALELTRLVVITSGASASASELVINALRPFKAVLTVGDRTYGEPVGQYAIPFCDKIFAPVSFTIRNANDEGDYYDGFAPHCPAPDDINDSLGDPAERVLVEALTVAKTGSCSSTDPRPASKRHGGARGGGNRSSTPTELHREVC